MKRIIEIGDSKDLIKTTERLFKPGSRAYKKRMYCNACKRKWGNSEKVYFASTSKGNKLVCSDCKNKLEE